MVVKRGPNVCEEGNIKNSRVNNFWHTDGDDKLHSYALVTHEQCCSTRVRISSGLGPKYERLELELGLEHWCSRFGSSPRRVRPIFMPKKA